jgi:glycosyltransferase involved in cell wall biosynthesis
MKVCIVQSVLPLYAISFFNKIVDLYPEIELTLLADLQSRESLNQYQPALCRFKVRQLDSVQVKGVYFRPGILRILREQQPDVIVFSATPREWSQLFALALCRALGRKSAVWGMFHRVGGPRRFTTSYFRLLAMFADRCLTYTRVGAMQIVGQGVSKSLVRVVGTAIDEQEIFKHADAMTMKQLRQFRLDNDIDGKRIILQVVRLSRVKRPEFLIHAMKVLLQQRNDVMAVLIGDGEMRSELEQLAAALGIEQSIRFLGAIYDERQLCPWYLSSDVFVVPTFLGLSGHHAMSYGLPVVTDDSLGQQGSEFEILADGLNGLTYVEGCPSDLARTLNRIISDSDLQGFLSTNARKTIVNTHNLERKTRRFVEVLRELVEL